MKIVQLTPGSGDSFYCENCLRDHDLVRAQRKLGHDTILVPLYLPILGEDPERGSRVFFGGINVYLREKASFFRHAPRWLDRLLDSPRLLRWAARRAGMTRAEDLGATTISMLRGEHGRQSKELEKLVAWLRAAERPDVVCLSNVLLAGLARRIREALDVPIVCHLQGEHTFLDGLRESDRNEAWGVLRERVRDIDGFVASSGFYRQEMIDRLGLPPERVSVVWNGIALDAYVPAPAAPDSPVVGYLARMCRGGGLDTLAEALILIKARGRVPRVRLRATGGKTADDDDFIEGVRCRLAAEGLAGDVEILPNLLGAEKIEFLRSLSVLSVPSTLGEAFGIFVVEALAMGVPVVLPRHGAFPELVEATGGGLLCEPGDPVSLADGLEELLLDPARARALGERGRLAARERFSVERTAFETVKAYEDALARGGRHGVLA